ncbi:integrase [Mycobacterium tuberculosis]|nr:integrase [Mycobacterium tuberculosis]RYA13378.1 integrase [Mycobacterium tuberculosis]WJH75292.1 integrase [Mycobacterium tuberculosis complex sp. N0072]
MATRHQRAGIDDRWHKRVKGPDGNRRTVRSAVCGRVSRWRVRWVDGGGEEHSKSFQRKPDAQVPDPCRTVEARQGHGPVRNAHLGARLLRLTAVYGSVRLLPCGASMWGIAC